MVLVYQRIALLYIAKRKINIQSIFCHIILTKFLNKIFIFAHLIIRKFLFLY